MKDYHGSSCLTDSFGSSAGPLPAFKARGPHRGVRRRRVGRGREAPPAVPAGQRGSKVLGVALVAFAAACYLRKPAAFVPGPLRQHAAPLAAASAATMFAPAAFADEISDAAKKLGDGSYDFAKEVDWNYGLYLHSPGAFKPLEALKAIDKMIVMGAAADHKLLQAAGEAHDKAIGSVSGANGMTSRADWDAVNAALGRARVRARVHGHGCLQRRLSHHRPGPSRRSRTASPRSSSLRTRWSSS